MSILFFILAFIANGSANVLLKLAAVHGVPLDSLVRGTVTVGHLYAAAAAFLFAINLVFYLLALKHIPLSVGYPVMVGMTFVVVSVSSIFIFRESITSAQVVGYILIACGMMLILRFA